LNARRDVHSQPFYAQRSARAGGLGDFAHVDAGADLGQVGFGGMHFLKFQREGDRTARGIESLKATVAGPIDDAAARLLAQRFDARPMARDEFPGRVVPLFRLKRSGIDDVSEYKAKKF